MRLFRFLYNGIRNLCIWFKVIWYDSPHDYHYFFVMLRKKLFLMEQFIRVKGCHEDHIEDADNIKECIRLLDKIIADDYEDMAVIVVDIRDLFKIIDNNVLGWWD